MRVRVGDQWYEASIDQPIAIEVMPWERLEILQMPPRANRYGQFADDDTRSEEERRRWLTQG